jgi:hypothetical protein
MKQTIRILSTTTLLATTLLVSGCKKKETTSSTGSATPPAGSAAPAPAADAPAAPAADTTTVVKADALAAIKFPVPKGAPADGEWKDQESTKDGERHGYYGKGQDYFLMAQILDCNLPRMKEDEKKPAGERNADAGYCLGKFEGKLKDYPMSTEFSGVRTVKVGHLSVSVNSGPAGKYTEADLEEYLGGLDLAALAKL